MLDDSQPSTASPFAEPPVAPPSDAQPIAPWWHTAAVVALLLAWTLLTRPRAAAIESAHSVGYLSSILMGWMLLGAVVAGVYHRRRFFADTLERNAKPWFVEAARVPMIFFAYYAAALLAVVPMHFAHLHPGFGQHVIAAMSPQTFRELLLWLGVCLTAGFCEEHVFRGYLLTQSIAGFRRIGASGLLAAALSVLLTSTLFACLHLYEGVFGAVVIGLLGAVYSLFALRFRNLRAVILAHAAQDFLVGSLLLLRHTHTS
jgi:membrane protease YdiL (CAAX protease family)